MKKKVLLSVFLVLVGLIAVAQVITVTSTELVKLKDNSKAFSPRFSPGGDYLLFSSSGYKGLKIYEFATKTLKNLTDDAGAGYNPQMSTDGKTILYTKTELVKNLRYNTLVQIEKATNEKKLITKPSREALSAQFSDNKPIYVSARKMLQSQASTGDLKPMITIENRKMVLYSASGRKELAPNGQDVSYIWPSLSFDKKNIVYTVVGKGTFVCKTDGSNPVWLGKLNAPVWLTNQWLLGMDDKDDGEKIISSKLVVVSISGKQRQTLPTPANSMAMYPAASADGSRIAFNTEKGELYLLNIQIK